MVLSFSCPEKHPCWYHSEERSDEESGLRCLGKHSAFLRNVFVWDGICGVFSSFVVLACQHECLFGNQLPAKAALQFVHESGVDHAFHPGAGQSHFHIGDKEVTTFVVGIALVVWYNRIDRNHGG